MNVQAVLSRLINIAVVASAFMLAAGCASTFTSRVSVFHQLPPDPGELTFELTAGGNEPDTLEHRSYRQQVKDALIARGFREANPARYLVGFEYSVTPQTRSVVRAEPVPYPSISFGYGWWGGRSGASLGLGWPGYWGGSPYWGPNWVNVAHAEVVHEHRLRLEMFRNGAAAADSRVYEGTAIAAAYQPDMPAIMPLLLRALMQEFPGRSGESRTVTLEIPRR